MLPTRGVIQYGNQFCRLLEHGQSLADCFIGSSRMSRRSVSFIFHPWWYLLQFGKSYAVIWRSRQHDNQQNAPFLSTFVRNSRTTFDSSLLHESHGFGPLRERPCLSDLEPMFLKQIEEFFVDCQKVRDIEFILMATTIPLALERYGTAPQKSPSDQVTSGSSPAETKQSD
jgi:hypothetical protein